ncbi:MAG TPA: phenylalanine--tRNA ligase subunit alpha [Candidatus Azoamicus sp. OHIO2]
MSPEKILDFFLKEYSTVKNKEELHNLKIKYLGRNGFIPVTFKKAKVLNLTDTLSFFTNLNKIKTYITQKITQKYDFFLLEKSYDALDITLPGYGFEFGVKHIISTTINEIDFFFTRLGFNIYNGYEIDSTYYNFEALNMPLSHPSRNLNETFYISDDILLRTHTSNMQVHIMQSSIPPLKIISHGKVYRKDYDASHTPMFHQVEAIVIDKNISIANLKYLLFEFLQFFFKKEIKINFRSSYFPFTEPSMELDIQCINCLGKKCTLCKYSGWIEILGCGMIHSNVLTNCNIDKKKYTGLAFGLGIERLTMIKYNITDIRLYFENNLEFLKQF